MIYQIRENAHGCHQRSSPFSCRNSRRVHLHISSLNMSWIFVLPLSNQGQPSGPLGFFLGALSQKSEQSLREQILRWECVNQVQQSSSESNPQIRSDTVPSTINADGKPAGTKAKNEKTDGNIKR